LAEISQAIISRVKENSSALEECEDLTESALSRLDKVIDENTM
jgi:hypothetical protein